MLFSTPQLTTREREICEQIDRARRHLQDAVQQRHWTGFLGRMLVARAIQGSNSIAGYCVSDEDAMAAVLGEEPIATRGETWAAVTGYRDATMYVLQLSDDLHFKHSSDVLRSLHFMMLRYALDKRPGRYRPGPVLVRNDKTGDQVYEGPNAEHVPERIDHLVAWLNTKDTEAPSLVRAAMSHLNLVMVHPFTDGNGRIARCLQTLVLAREGMLSPEFCSVEEYLGRHRPEYYDVLAEVGAGSWNPERNARPWVQFCLTAHLRQASKLRRRARETQRLWDSVEELVARRSLPARMATALATAATRPRVPIRNRYYRVAAGVSYNLATRDLKVMCDAGLLVPRGERRGRWYFATPELIRLREAGREAPDVTEVTDPFREPCLQDMSHQG